MMHWHRDHRHRGGGDDSVPLQLPLADTWIALASRWTQTFGACSGYAELLVRACADEKDVPDGVASLRPSPSYSSSPAPALPMQRAVWIQVLRSQTRSFPHPSQLEVKRSHKNPRHRDPPHWHPRLEAAPETGRVKPEPPAATLCYGGGRANSDVAILITLSCHCPVT